TDLGDRDGVQPPDRIDTVAYRTAGQDAGADIVSDRIAGEAGERRDPVGYVGPPDRAQREQIVERQREIAPSDAERGDREVVRIGLPQRRDHLADLDVAQVAIERHRRDREYGDAEQEADPVPADRLVAEARNGAQRFEYPAVALRRLRLHLGPVTGLNCEWHGREH